MLTVLAVAKLAVHLLTNYAGAYGYFRDEFYYLACADHLAFGYVDQPLLSIAVLWMSRTLFGTSLVALRLVPAIAGAAVVVLTGLMAGELGGKRFAQGIAALAVLVTPQYLGFDNIFSMNALDTMFWTASLYVVLLIVRGYSLSLWIPLGIILGLGLENKISVMWLCAALFTGLLLTQHRSLLLTTWPWLSAVIAFVLFLPYVIWQAANDWPTVEFITNASAYKYAVSNPADFFLQQILFMNPLNALVWIPGLFALLLTKKMELYRILGIIYLVVALILNLNPTSKAEYLAASYPVLFAAGGCFLEGLFESRLTWVKPTLVSAMLVSGAILAPFAIPVLPVESYIEYAESLGMKPSTTERKDVGKLPQYYADMFGWENMVATIARAYHALPDSERSECVIFGRNYGEAGAVDFYRKKYGLPPAISGHNSYWLWGPGNRAGKVVIVLGGSMDDLQRRFESVTAVDTVRSPYAMPYENNLPVYVCRKIRQSVQVIWPQVRHYE